MAMTTAERSRLYRRRQAEKKRDAKRDGRDATEAEKTSRIVTEIVTAIKQIQQDIEALRNEIVTLKKGSNGSPLHPLPITLKNTTPLSLLRETSPQGEFVGFRKQEIDEGFDQFWRVWPHRVGKAPARVSFRRALGKTTLEAILDGVREYINHKPADRSWCNPATWLNQERWNDEYQTNVIRLSQPRGPREPAPTLRELGLEA